MINYKVSYNSYYHGGYHYDQLINVLCSKSKLYKVNKKIEDTLTTIKLKTVKSENEMNYLSYCRKFNIGNNYCTNHMLRLFASEFGVTSRLKFNRNTVIRFKVY